MVKEGANCGKWGRNARAALQILFDDATANTLIYAVILLQKQQHQQQQRTGKTTIRRGRWQP